MTRSLVSGANELVSTAGDLNLFGVNVPADDSLRNAMRLSVEETKQDLADDRMVNAAAPNRSAPAAGEPLLFADCGLPRVRRYPLYVNEYLNDWSRSNSLGSVGLSGAAVEQLLPENDVRVTSGLFPGFLRRVSYLFARTALLNRRVLENEPKFLNKLSFLSRLDWRESDEWQSGSGLWMQVNGTPLSQYFVEFFSGRFVDRNGMSIATSFNLGELQFDQLEVSPKLAGQIVNVLIEFLFDRKFGIPFYSGSTLETYRNYRATAAGQTQLTADISALETALKTEDWTPLVSGTQFYSATIRSGLNRLQELDKSFTAGASSVDSLKGEIDAIEAGTSDSLLRFTGFKTGLISTHLHCVFMNSGGVCGRDNDTGKTGTDYADLLGKIVAYSARNAEKQTRASVGALIRGLSIASLNNEVLSEMIASSAGTLAKKTAEAVTYRFMHRLITDPTVLPNAAQKKVLLDFLEGMHVFGKFKIENSPGVAPAIPVPAPAPADTEVATSAASDVQQPGSPETVQA